MVAEACIGQYKHLKYLEGAGVVGGGGGGSAPRVEHLGIYFEGK